MMADSDTPGADLMAAFPWARADIAIKTVQQLPIADPDILRILEAHAQLKRFYDTFTDAKIIRPPARSSNAFLGVREVAHILPSPISEQNMPSERPPGDENKGGSTDATNPKAEQSVAGPSKTGCTNTPSQKVFQKARRSRPEPYTIPSALSRTDQEKALVPRVYQKARRSRPQDYQSQLPRRDTPSDKSAGSEHIAQIVPETTRPLEQPAATLSKPKNSDPPAAENAPGNASNEPIPATPVTPMSFLDMIASRPAGSSKIRRVKVNDTTPTQAPPKQLQQPESPVLASIAPLCPTVKTQAKAWLSATAHCRPRVRRNVIDLSPSPPPELSTDLREGRMTKPLKKGIARVVKESAIVSKRAKKHECIRGSRDGERKKVRFEESRH